MVTLKVKRKAIKLRWFLFLIKILLGIFLGTLINLILKVGRNNKVLQFSVVLVSNMLLILLLGF